LVPIPQQPIRSSPQLPFNSVAPRLAPPREISAALRGGNDAPASSTSLNSARRAPPGIFVSTATSNSGSVLFALASLRTALIMLAIVSFVGFELAIAPPSPPQQHSTPDREDHAHDECRP